MNSWAERYRDPWRLNRCRRQGHAGGFPGWAAAESAMRELDQVIHQTRLIARPRSKRAMRHPNISRDRSCTSVHPSGRSQGDAAAMLIDTDGVLPGGCQSRHSRPQVGEFDVDPTPGAVSDSFSNRHDCPFSSLDGGRMAGTRKSGRLAGRHDRQHPV